MIPLFVSQSKRSNLMRYLALLLFGMTTFALINHSSLTGLKPAQFLGLSTQLIIILAAVNLFRPQKHVTRPAVYLALLITLFVICWSIYLFSFIPPPLLFWLVLSMVALFVVLTIRDPARTKQKREDAGLCPQCGYDLRATEDRCPECSAPVPTTIQRRRRAGAKVQESNEAGNAQAQKINLSWLILLTLSLRASAADPAAVTLYDPNPNHLWNRLHQTLFVRTSADGVIFGRDSLDPPLFAETNFLLKGPSQPKALAVLDEFLTTHGEKLIDDPLKIAILQRDLWFAFDWAYKGDFSRANDDRTPARHALQTRLAKIINRLALNPSQIAALPDNYAAAIKSGRFATAYDPARPAQAFLPDDLLSPNGPWVAVMSSDNFAAKFHINDFGGRYAFDLFINLPGGRAATLAYLQHPWPALPRGTQLALLRRPLLIDTEGKLHSSALVESMQMRIFRQVPRHATPLSANRLKDDGETDVFEIVRSRAALFTGEAGGLRAVPPDEKGLPSPIRAHLADEIQQAGQHIPGERQKPIEEVMLPILNQCIGCHISGRLETAYAHLVPLEKNILDVNASAVVTWKIQQKDWKELIALMQK